MQDETLSAFAPLDRRVEGNSRPYDRISLRDYMYDADIGAFQQERGQMQRLCFNIVAELQPYDSHLGDDVDKILSYDHLTDAIKAELAQERLNLLETLAENIAQRILARPQTARIFVRIEKLDRGPGALGVEIMRRRGDDAPAPAKGNETVPMVVCLDPHFMASGDLPVWLDRLQKTGKAVVLVPPMPDNIPIRAENTHARRRIGLLALEQNAWALAAHDARCSVVATRTELDWAIKHHLTVIWAPSKMVLDAVAGPLSDSPLDLADWLARLLGGTGAMRLQDMF